MPSDDLITLARSGTDYYTLLSTPQNTLHSASSESDIKRAYRRAALLHHPDKHRDDPNATDRFHALQVAYDILTDAEAKAAFDTDQAARQRKRDQGERLDGRRRAFADELLKAERGESELGKRKRGEEEEFQTELQRIAADGARRRMARSEALRKEAEKQREAEEAARTEGIKVAEQQTGGTNVPEISRTVKVRFSREGAGMEVDEAMMHNLMKKFGNVDSVMMLKDRKIKPSTGERKINMGTAAVLYSSIVSAHSAVEDYKKQNGPGWTMIDKIEWAEGKEPDCLASATTISQGINASNGSTTSKPNATKWPAFAGFKPQIATSGGPSFEEMTFMRLKKAEQRKAEKRKLEEQMRREEADPATTSEIPIS